MAKKLLERETFWALSSLCKAAPDIRQGYSFASFKHKR